MPGYIGGYTPVAKNPVNGRIVWTGAVSTDFAAKENWLTEAGGAVSYDVRSGDTCIFNAGSVGSRAALSNTVRLNALLIGEGYTGDIGTASLWHSINADVVSLRKRDGKFALFGDVTDFYINRTATGNQNATIGVTTPVYLFGCNITNLVILEGKVTINNSGGYTITNLICCPRAGRDVTVDLLASSPVTNMRLYGRTRVTSAANTTTLTVRGGSEGVFTGSASHGTVDISHDAVVNHQGTGDISGTVTVETGAVFRLRDNPDADLTIDKIDMYSGGIADLRTGLNSVTVTNGANAFGGYALVDDGDTFSF
jgi:hypothetical protein